MKMEGKVCVKKLSLVPPSDENSDSPSVAKKTQIPTLKKNPYHSPQNAGSNTITWTSIVR